MLPHRLEVGCAGALALELGEALVAGQPGDVAPQLETLMPPSEPSTHAAIEELPVLEAAREQLSAAQDWTPDTLKGIVKEIGRTAGAKGPALYTPLRRALTGAEHGPGLVAILRVQGRDRALQQLEHAIDRTKNADIENE